MILSFKPCFVPAVVAGKKPHSLRAGQRWRAGMGIQFYQGSYRQKRDKFRPDSVADGVQAVKIPRQPPGVAAGRLAPTIIVDDHELTPHACKLLARNDGFPDAYELLRFVEQLHGLPFEGQLIHWTPLRY